MIDVVFTVSPSGIFGMDILAKFLNGLKQAGTISDWRPGRAQSGSKGLRYVVSLNDRHDADCAEARWKALPPTHA